MMKVLLIEDEFELGESIKDYFSGNDFVCEWVTDKETALDKIQSYQYDCILLDLMLPDGDGFDILKEIKQLNKIDGVIIISAKETLDARIEGLQLGADDYLTKPFHLSELLVRTQAIIRRKNFQGSNKVAFKEVEIDFLAKEVKVSDKKVELTKTEYELLLFLLSNRNKVLSRGTIAEHLSGDMADMLDNHDFVYAHTKNLKNKLKQAGMKDYIKTVYGLGYKWQDE